MTSLHLYPSGTVTQPGVVGTSLHISIIFEVAYILYIVSLCVLHEL